MTTQDPVTDAQRQRALEQTLAKLKSLQRHAQDVAANTAGFEPEDWKEACYRAATDLMYWSCKLWMLSTGTSRGIAEDIAEANVLHHYPEH